MKTETLPAIFCAKCNPSTYGEQIYPTWVRNPPCVIKCEHCGNTWKSANVETGEDIYDSVYMKVVELVEKDNTRCGSYLDTAKKLKEKYIIQEK